MVKIESEGASKYVPTVEGIYDTAKVTAMQAVVGEFEGVSIEVVAAGGEEYTDRLGGKSVVREGGTRVKITGYCDRSSGLEPLYRAAEQNLQERAQG